MVGLYNCFLDLEIGSRPRVTPQQRAMCRELLSSVAEDKVVMMTIGDLGQRCAR